MRVNREERWSWVSRGGLPGTAIAAAQSVRDQGRIRPTLATRDTQLIRDHEGDADNSLRR